MKIVKNIVYNLKRMYGQKAILRIKTIVNKDYKTGYGSINVANICIKRCILLPVTTKVDFSYDLSYIAANKNFTYGGLFDQNTRIAIIDSKDTSVRPKTNDEILFGSNKYQIIQITDALDNDAYILKLKGLESDGS